MSRGRHRFRFSLQVMLFSLTLVGIFLGMKARHAYVQRSVVVWVKQNGGEAFYDFELEAPLEASPDSDLPGPDWLCRLLGKDFFASVTAIAFNGSSVSDTSPLLGLPELVSLDLEGTSVRDVANLAHLSKLKILSLRHTQVSDISALGRLSRLEYLNLKCTQVADISALTRLTRLRWLDLSETKVGDLSPLLELSGLSHLGLNHMERLEQADIAQLQQSMRDCEIEANRKPPVPGT